MGKRMFAVLLAALLCLSFVSCADETEFSDGNVSENSADAGQNGSETEHSEKEGSETEEKSVPSEEDEEQKHDYFSEIEKRDFGGREFVIATTDASFVESAEKSGFVGSFLYERNRAVEEKFGIKIKVVEMGEAQIQLALQASENSGEPFCDLLYVPMSTASNYGARGLIMNIYSVPFFDFDAEYAQYELTKSLSVKDTLYGVYGSAAFDERSAWCVFYNKAAFPEAEDPYTLAKNGQWTWEKFLELAEKSTADLDGNGRMNKNTDRYGYSSTMNTSAFANAVFSSMGKSFFTFDEEGYPVMDFAVSDEDDYVSLIKRICVQEDSLYPERNPGAGALDAFNSGRLSMFCERVSYTPSLAYSETDWGIVPMPKMTADSEYSSLVDGSVLGYSVPYNTYDSDLSGLVLDAIYAYSYTCGGGVLENAWINYYLRDNSSALMLGKIFDSVRYDLAFAFGEGFSDFSIASYDILQSVNEKNVNFGYLYSQNEKPFAAFAREEFTN